MSFLFGDSFGLGGGVDLPYLGGALEGLLAFDRAAGLHDSTLIPTASRAARQIACGPDDAYSDSIAGPLDG